MQLPEAVTQVAAGIYQVQIPLPFALRIVNCYLLEGDGGWTVVDTGLHRPDAEAIWRAAFDALHVEPGHITQIVLTHMHPDHYGMAGWFQALTGAPVRMSAREAESALVTWVYADPRYALIDAQMHKGGVPQEIIDVVTEGIESTRQMTFPHPKQIEHIAYGSTVRMGGRDFKAIHAPGHSDGLIMFYDEAEKLVLSGDHVLMKITPNIGLWVDTEPQPLGRFMGSLRALQHLDVKLALPGHKALITDWGGRIGELLHHHDERLSKTLDAVKGGAVAFDVARALFNFERLSAHEMRFALVETLAHLEYLVGIGAVQQTDGVAWRFEQR